MEKCFEELTVQSINRAFLFNGSLGRPFHDFRYRLEQNGKEPIVHAATYSKICYEKAEDVEKQDFDWNEEGIAKLREWLQSQYEKFKEQEGLSG